MNPVTFGKSMALALPVALLAACGGQDSGEADDRTASGEVLEGTISDAMIPLDQLKSQPPLLRVRAAADGAAEDDREAEAGGDEDPGENPLLAEDAPAG